MAKKQRRVVSPFAKIKHVCRWVERSRSTHGLYALEGCAHAGCSKVRTTLLEDDECPPVDDTGS